MFPICSPHDHDIILRPLRSCSAPLSAPSSSPPARPPRSTTLTASSSVWTSSGRSWRHCRTRTWTNRPWGTCSRWPTRMATEGSATGSSGECLNMYSRQSLQIKLSSLDKRKLGECAVQLAFYPESFCICLDRKITKITFYRAERCDAIFLFRWT